MTLPQSPKQTFARQLANLFLQQKWIQGGGSWKDAVLYLQVLHGTPASGGT